MRCCQKIKLKPKCKLCGEIEIISSKSYLHRYLILSAFADKKTQLEIHGDISEDIKATILVLQSLGASIDIKPKYITVEPIKVLNTKVKVNMKESGSTLRFFIPIFALLGVEAEIDAYPSLKKRPIEQIIKMLKKCGVSFSSESLPFIQKGKIDDSKIKTPTEITSQYVTGFLLGAAIVNKSQVVVSDEVVSKPYINMTISALSDFGIDIKEEDNRFKLSNNHINSKGKYKIESDYSQATFFIILSIFNHELKIKNLPKKSVQGDMKIIKILEDAGVVFLSKNNKLSVKRYSFKPFNLNCGDIPDIVPALCVLSSCIEGRHIFHNTHRLKYKESDRIKSTVELINNLGGNAKYIDDKIIIEGVKNLKSGSIQTYNDHRILMSAVVASQLSRGDIFLDNISCVNKSYPNFFEEYARLGGEYERI